METITYPEMKTCSRYTARVTPGFCERSQRKAQEVFLKLVAYPENGIKISDISNIDLDRFIVCGDCPDNPMPLPVDLIEQRVMESIKLSLKEIIKEAKDD